MTHLHTNYNFNNYNQKLKSQDLYRENSSKNT